MKLVNKAGLIILALFLIFIAGSCACPAGSVHYSTPKEFVPYETIINEYRASIGENISEKEAQELFTILKNLCDATGHESGKGVIYIPEPFDRHIEIDLDLISMERGEGDFLFTERPMKEKFEDEIDEIIEVHTGEHYGAWDSLYGWHNYFYFKRALGGGWCLIYCVHTVE